MKEKKNRITGVKFKFSFCLVVRT